VRAGISKRMTAPPPRTSGFIDPCIPTRAHKVPAGPDWVHEIKHDGYRLKVRRAGDAVRLFTWRGYDWSGRYPAITLTAMQLRADSFTRDGRPASAGRMASRPRRSAPPWHRQRRHAVRLRALGLDGEDLRGPAARRPQEAPSEGTGANARRPRLASVL
jgi:ATP-dependent DNA ligase